MARINVEDSIYRDPRFLQLAMKLGGDMDRALGGLVRAWDLAQRWYLRTPDKMIPLSEWNDRQIPQAIVEVGLAEIIQDRVRVKGSDEQFRWLIQKSEAGRKNKGKSRERILADDSGTSRIESSPSPSPPPSPSISKAAEGVLTTSPLTLGFKDEALVKLLIARGVSQVQWDAWVRVYTNRTWISDQIKKADAWACANPIKKEDSFAALVTRWLARDRTGPPKQAQNLSTLVPPALAKEFEEQDRLRRQEGLL